MESLARLDAISTRQLAAKFHEKKLRKINGRCADSSIVLLI